MSRVNEAYSVALAFMEAGAQQREQLLREADMQRQTQPTQHEQAERRQSERARNARTSNATRRGAIGRPFLPLIETIVNALYAYYQYGLENVHLRREGFKRMRFRSSQRRLTDGIARLTARIEMERVDDEAARIFLEFARAFSDNMAIDSYYIPTKDVAETKAYQLYRDASSKLDTAIKRQFCAELIGIHDRMWNGGMEIIYYELMLVLTKYHTTKWVNETLIKMNLLEHFQNTLTLFQFTRRRSTAR